MQIFFELAILLPKICLTEILIYLHKDKFAMGGGGWNNLHTHEQGAGTINCSTYALRHTTQLMGKNDVDLYSQSFSFTVSKCVIAGKTTSLLCVSFLICKMRKIIVPFPQGCCVKRMKEFWKALCNYSVKKALISHYHYWQRDICSRISEKWTEFCSQTPHSPQVNGHIQVFSKVSETGFFKG